MEAPEIEKEIRQLFFGAPSACPDVALLAGTPSDAEASAIALHLGECPRCAEIVRVAATPTEEHDVAPERWSRLLAKARSLSSSNPATPSESLIRVVVRAVREALEVVSIVGDLVEPVPIRSESHGGVLVRRSFGQHSLTAHIGLQGTAVFGLTVDLWSGEHPADDLRVTLHRADREVKSALPRGGRVNFSGLTAGTYRLALGGRRRQVGAVDLILESDAP